MTFDYEVAIAKSIGGAGLVAAFALKMGWPDNLVIGAALGGVVLGIVYDLIAFKFKSKG